MRSWLAAGALLAAVAPALAQAPPVALTRRVEHPRTLTLDDLPAMAPVTVKVDQANASGVQEATFTGALLWDVVTAAKPVDAPGDKTTLQHTFLARGKDGYAVALAIAELDPNYEKKRVVIAYVRDGKPLPAARLVVPGDAHAGRSVRDLVAIEVR